LKCVSSETEPPSRVAKTNLVNAVANLECPHVAAVTGYQALYPGLRPRAFDRLQIGVAIEHFKGQAKRPPSAVADLAVGHGLQVPTERRPEHSDHGFRGLERDATNQQQRPVYQ
jgi:hypothetical protein